MRKIAIIGGGIAGATTALLLNEEITLFEKKDSLISGPPFCHLHAGGNLYPDISINECKALLKESIDFLKLYPFGIDYRPTLITFPKSCEIEPKDFLKRLKIVKKEYEKLINIDSSNKVLGEAKDYYKIIYKKDLEKLKDKEISKEYKTYLDWLIAVAKYINLDSLKYPLFLVNEFGLNMFKIAAGSELALTNKNNLILKLNSEVIDVKRIKDKFIVTYELDDGAILEEKFDYLINAAGFFSGKIDDMLRYKRKRYIEFKAAYVTKWQDKIKFPEIIFHGKRGSKKGMAQFTPYFGGYYQLHGMSKDITLFKNGLVQSTNSSSYPKLDKFFIDIIKKGWSRDLASIRTKEAINHFKNFIPLFAKEANITPIPLYGAQQIPGNNPNLRAAEVSFEDKNYARCEIVKVSSAINMAKKIAKKFGLQYSNINIDIKDNQIRSLSMKIATNRGYPKELGIVLNSNLV